MSLTTCVKFCMHKPYNKTKVSKLSYLHKNFNGTETTLLDYFVK